MKTSKKEIKDLVNKTLTEQLADLKKGMSEKLYAKNIKKATRILIADFKAPKPAKPAKSSRPAKKQKKAKNEQSLPAVEQIQANS